MPSFLLPYASTLTALFVLAVLIAIQFGVADIAGIRAKHVPGMPVIGGHGDFFFRATRAHANSQETLGLFLLLVLLCLFSAANPKWTDNYVWLFVAARAGHMVCYYADWRAARSGFFTLGALAEVGMLILVAFALL